MTEFLAEVSDPKSPNYRHYLTPAQFTEQYGPTEQDYEAVAAFAKAQGLTVTRTHSNRMILDVQGTASSVEKTFNVRMMTYQHPTQARKFYAPDAAPSVALNVPILDVSGLDNYALPQPQYRLNPNKGLAAAKAKPGAVVGPGYSTAAPNGGTAPNGDFMGNDFRNAYAPGVAQYGSGQKVGLLQFDGYTTSDITYYESMAGLPNVPLTNVLLDGFSGTPTGNGGEVEVSLDIEMCVSMAQQLSGIIVYEAGPSGSWHDILNQMATDDAANQLSCSWYIPSGASDPTADQIFEEMAAQGQSFFSASGDYDAFTGLIPFPGDSPYITIVGGTMLTTNGAGGSYASEAAWNRNDGVGTGGGISTQYAIPTWQQGISMSANLGSNTMRNVPDVALTAEDVYVRADGSDQSVGGTSCAAPLWAAFASLINQQAQAYSNKPIGFINPAVYTLGLGSNYNADFHDTTSGNNFWTSSPAKFPAVTGYDLCTGWGSPQGAATISALAGPSVPTITTTSPLNSGEVGLAYSQTLAVSGGVSPYTWLVSAGTLPSGLTLSAGVLSGTPTAAAAGTTNFTVEVMDSRGNFSTTPFALTIYAQGTPLITTSSPLPSGNATVSYSQTLAASGGVMPYTWSLSSGSLPSGLTLGSSTGVISGVPTTTGTATFAVQVTDSNGLSSSAPFSLTINAAPTPPTITTASPLPTGKTGSSYTQTLIATGGTTPYTWSLASGSLPPGLNLASTGMISGTPVTYGTASFSVRVTGGNGLATITPFFLTVLPQGTLLTNGSFETASFTNWVTTDLAGAFVPLQVIANGFSPGYGLFSTAATDGSYSAVNGFDSTTAGTIRIAHDVTISASAPYLTFDYRAGWDMKDYTGSTLARTFAVTIEPSGGGATLASYTQLTAQPGTVTLDTGPLSGSINLSAYAGTSIRVCFDCIIPQSHTGPGLFELDNVRLGSSTIPIISTSSPLTGGTVGTSYTNTLTASGGTTPYYWSLASGSLPAGLYLGSSGVISGVPGAAGTSSFVAEVASPNGQYSTKAFALTISPGAAPTPPTITTTSPLPAGNVSSSYSVTLAASGGTTPYSWSMISGSLPAGFSLSTAGTISGIPTTTGTSSFTVQVTGGNGLSSSATFSLTINPAPIPPTITTTSPLPLGTVGVAYTGTFSASGGVSPYTWLVTSGSLPSGLSLSSAGVISGTPGSAGTANFTVQATGADGGVTSAPFSLTTGAGSLAHFAWSTIASPQNVGTPFAATITAQDVGNDTVTSFAGTVSLMAGATQNLLNSPVPTSSNNNNTWTLGYSFTPSANLTVTGVRSYSGTKVSIWTSAGVLVASTPVSGTQATWTDTPLQTPVQLQAGTTYVVGFLTGGTTYYWSTTLSSTFANGTINQGYESVGDTFPTATDADRWCMVDLDYSVGASTPISPTTTGSFTAGVWTGSITVAQPVTGVSIQASDGAGHTGNSNAFNVTATANMSVTPATGLTSAGSIGGPFAPVSTTYTINNSGTGAMTWTAAVTQPWMSLSASSGTVSSGTSTQVTVYVNTVANGLGIASYTDTVTFTNTVNGLGNTTRPISLTVLPPAPTITSATTATATVNQSFTYQITGSNGPSSFGATGLPSGLSVNSSGLISGTPTIGGLSNVIISASNAGGTGSTTLALTVLQPPAITSSPAPATDNSPYSFTFATQGYPTSTFTLSSGSLPTGLTLSPAGVITGTPTVGANFTAAVTANNGVGTAATETFTLVVQQPPTILNGPPPAGTPNIPYNFGYSYQANPAPTFTVTSGALPPGLTLSPSGVITGTPTSPGTYSGVVTASNGISPSATQNFSIAIILGTPTLNAEPPLTLGTSSTVSWNGVAGGVQYEVEASTSPSFTSVIDSGWITGTSYTFNGLVVGTTYYYRVRVSDASGPDGAWSQTTQAAFNTDTLTNIVDGTGNLFVGDSGNNTIREVTTAGVVTTFAGQAGVAGSADGVGTGALLNYPTGVVFDTNDNLYLADYQNNTIRKFAPNGTSSTFAGLAGSSGSADGQGSAARFNNPFGIAIDAGGNFYVADRNNATIRKITPGGLVSTFVGTVGVTGYANGTGTATLFHWPAFPAVDSSGNVYVADQSNSVIRKITPAGVVTTLAGSPGVFSSADGTGSAAEFNNPTSCALDSNGNLYVADNGNATIRKVTISGGVVTTFAGLAGTTGSTNGYGSAARFNRPVAVAVDGTGNVYVADNFNQTIRKITPGAIVSTIAGSPQVTGSTDGTGSAARFDLPAGIAVDATGGMILATTGTLYDTTGTIVSTAIAPNPLQQWGVLTYADNVTASRTSVTVDVLNSSGGLLAASVASGTNLNTIPAVASAASIELRANLSTQIPLNTPVFQSWSVNYYGSGVSGWSGTATSTQGLAPTLTNGAFPATMPVNAAFTFSYAASASPAPTFSVSSGALPTGLTLSSTGTVTGTPTATGTFTGAVSAGNGLGSNATQSFSTVVTQPPAILSDPPPGGTAGVAYNFVYSVSGCPAPIFTSSLGSLPAGLTLSSSGVLSGTPATWGVYTGTVTASNGVGTPATQAFSLTFNSTFSSWASLNFTAQEMSNTAQTGPDVSYENDGVTNVLKYLFDINPTEIMTPADLAALPVVGTTTSNGVSYLTLTYRENPLISGVTVGVQTSTDLQTWTTVVPGLNQTVGSDPVTGDPIERVGVPLANPSCQFIRLNVTSP